MQTKEYFVEGWTEEIVEVLESNGVPLPDTTGMVAVLLLRSRSGTLATFAAPRAGFKNPGAAASPGAEAQAKVFFDPQGTDLLASESPYSVTWKVTAGGQVALFPLQYAVQWNVRKP